MGPDQHVLMQQTDSCKQDDSPKLASLRQDHQTLCNKVHRYAAILSK